MRTHPRRGLLLALTLSCLACACASSKPRTDSSPTQWQNEWIRGAVFYQVFTRSFADSNGDGVGDFKGLTGKLDYLNDGDPTTHQDLGVDAIWLMPFYPTPSYHGYDVIDYEGINPLYGSMDDFKELLAQAHRRGMKVIIDLVMNHTSDRHPWFVSAAASPDSPYRDWYVWSDTLKPWVQPFETGSHVAWHEKNGAYYYAAFFAGLPDLNYRNPKVREKMKSIAATWLERGVDGFRLDGARYLVETGIGLGQRDTPETHAFWREFAAFVRGVKPDATLVGEEWLPPDGTGIIGSYYGSGAVVKGGDELCMSFDFPLQSRIYEGVAAGDATSIAAKLAEVAKTYPVDAVNALVLDSADMDRISMAFKGDPTPLKLAAAVMLTLPGAPFVYYGEELGMVNGKLGKEDEQRRTPMPWSAAPSGGFTTGTPWYPLAPGWERVNVEAESKDPSSMLDWYRRLIHLRKGHAALREGDLKLLDTGSKAVLAYVREARGERVLVVHNLARTGLVGQPLSLSGQSSEVLLGSPGVKPLAGKPGAWQVDLPPQGSGIWKLSDGSTSQ